MPRFTKKRGEVGWPGPQCRRLERWAERYSVTCRLKAVADTGSHYYLLTGEDGSEITVRVSDHADVYATADYTIDPVYDQWPAVKKWITEHGTPPQRRLSKTTIDSITRRLIGVGMQYGYPWFSWRDDDAEVWFAVFPDSREFILEVRGDKALPVVDVIREIIKRYNLRSRYSE